MRLVTVARYDTPTEARLAEMLLKDAEIPCRVIGEQMHAMTAFFSPHQGAVQLQVPEDAAEEARAVLATLPEDLPPPDEEA